MAGLIPQSFIDDLVARTDIVELIGSARAAEESGARIPRLLPVPRREDAVVLGQPGQAVLSLLRLRRARHVLGFLMNYDR
jgi:DNA primase